ncbi:transposase [Novosphingobium sp. G106]|uniref:transposase n=1 Tax=Novosphingobium sp. G106 TaxID=2849500 RepID=UPI001C2CFFA5|nr:transposase [Novosphingobium sp. G106]MBV1691138.1 transposase [Novosphingobium sp. G106]
MPRVIDYANDTTASVAECVDELRARGFEPTDEESLQHAAGLLRRLGNDRTFLGDLLVEELSKGTRDDEGMASYGPQVIMLSPAGAAPDFFLRANIWPSPDEHAMRASGASTFVYGVPHDHNFDFLTLGYFGPGYWSDYYEYDYASVEGWRGEPADLRFAERTRLEEGKIMHYRAHRDIHAQHAADALSVSINVVHAGSAQGWLDQYRFDLGAGRVTGILNNGASEAFVRIAVGLGSEEAKDLAWRFGKAHPSDRMRLAAWSALASISIDPDTVWKEAERAGSRLVAAEARACRRELEAIPVG